jgi:hypothetical protein
VAIIHDTTMSPGKLELLRDWLPARPWYLASGRGPELAKAGGFRLDDPAGEVGIEFVFAWPVANGPVAVATSVVAADGPAGTDLRIQAAGPDGMPSRLLIMRINRILRPGDGASAAGEAGQPCLSAAWRLTEGTQVRGIFATARYLPEQATRP